jgi:hypothetical protein
MAGKDAATMEMLVNCLALIPIHSESALATLASFQQLLGPEGVYVNLDAPPPLPSTSTRAQIIAATLAQVQSNIVDSALPSNSHLPRRSDWAHVQQPLMDSLRQFKVCVCC